MFLAVLEFLSFNPSSFGLQVSSLLREQYFGSSSLIRNIPMGLLPTIMMPVRFTAKQLATSEAAGELRPDRFRGLREERVAQLPGGVVWQPRG